MSLATILDSLSVESIQEKDPAVTTTGPAVPVIQAAGSELPRRDDTPLDDGTLESVMDGVGELMDMGKKLSTEARHSELAMRGFAIQLEHLSKQPHMDFIPAHLTEYVTREGIKESVVNGIDKAFKWVKSKFAELGAKTKSDNKSDIDILKELIKANSERNTSYAGGVLTVADESALGDSIAIMGYMLGKPPYPKTGTELNFLIKQAMAHFEMLTSNGYIDKLSEFIVANFKDDKSINETAAELNKLLTSVGVYKLPVSKNILTPEYDTKVNTYYWTGPISLLKVTSPDGHPASVIDKLYNPIIINGKIYILKKSNPEYNVTYTKEEHAELIELAEKWVTITSSSSSPAGDKIHTSIRNALDKIEAYMDDVGDDIPEEKAYAIISMWKLLRTLGYSSYTAAWGDFRIVISTLLKDTKEESSKEKM